MTSHRRTLVAACATLLASAPLATIYAGLGWLARCAVAVVAVAAAAAAARALRAPLPVQVVAMLAALVGALTLLFSGGTSLLGVIPTGQTLERFGAVLSQLPADVQENSMPVGDVESLLLVTVGGVGLVAVLVDVCAVGMRRPALAGLPMLAVYSVPVAVSFDAVPVLLFAIGAVGYLWLVGSDNIVRVRRFGRRFTGDGRDVDPWAPSPLAAAGRRLAIVGVALALLLPLAVPGMTTGLIDRFGPGLDGGGGLGGAGQLNLFAELYGQLNQRETVELVELSTDDTDPFYLRLATADQIGDTGFRPSPPDGSPLSGDLATPPDTAGITYHEHRAQVRVHDEFQMALAPTYAHLVGVEGLSSRWLYDRGQQIVYSGRESAGGLEYEFTYLRPEYSADALRRARRLPAGHDIQERYGRAPLVPEVRSLLDEIVDPADPPYDQVIDILNHFSRRNGFRYSLQTGPETDAPAIVDFLENKAGFCVQYAAAMAWLVRSADLPARVAFGFTRGTRSGDGETRVLTNKNLHAWTEVYFDGFGWVPFDPTPASPVVGAIDPEWAPDPDAPPDRDPSDPDSPDTTASPGADPTATPAPADLDPEAGPTGGLFSNNDDGPPWWAVAVLAAVALGALPALNRLWLRRQRLSRRWARVGGAPDPAPGTVTSADPAAAHRHRTHLAWDELLDTMRDYGVPPHPTETPRATVGRVRSVLEPVDVGVGDALALLARAEERARYARHPDAPDGLVDAVRAVRRGLAARSGRATRARAVLLPPSTLRRWRMAVSRILTGTALVITRLGELTTHLSPRRLVRPAR
ncbi:MAG: DUF3488 and transglutaminase-like domain-containing protein [Micromonosporaceae bacterium]